MCFRNVDFSKVTEPARRPAGLRLPFLLEEDLFGLLYFEEGLVLINISSRVCRIDMISKVVFPDGIRARGTQRTIDRNIRAGRVFRRLLKSLYGQFDLVIALTFCVDKVQLGILCLSSLAFLQLNNT
jgi:hypothetical protein